MRHIDVVSRKASFVWNHALALQRRHSVHMANIAAASVWRCISQTECAVSSITRKLSKRFSSVLALPSIVSSPVRPNSRWSPARQGILLYRIQAGRLFPGRQRPYKKQNRQAVQVFIDPSLRLKSPNSHSKIQQYWWVFYRHAARQESIKQQYNIHIFQHMLISWKNLIHTKECQIAEGKDGL